MERLMANDDELVFADEEEPAKAHETLDTPWKVMIVDDEPEIHSITRLALSGFVFERRRLEFISAYSGAEAKARIAEHPDTAIMLLDVVMESEDAGLEIVRHVREVLENRMIRIILRTGQPGQAPERKVILEYDIDDYKTKTELTAQKLFTSIVSGLRAYAYLETIEQNRLGLEQIINASASIFKIQSLECFIQGVLTQLVSLLKLGKNTFYCGNGCLASDSRDTYFRIVAGTGSYSGYAGRKIEDILSASVLAEVRAAIARKEHVFAADHVVLFLMNSERRFGDNTLKNDRRKVAVERRRNDVSIDNRRKNIIYLENARELSVFDKDLLNIFCSNVAVAFDNIHLAEELEHTQKEVVERISAVAETRSEETGNHVRRVAEYGYLLARLSGMDEAEAQILREAAPMHDIGKVGIPDSILNKPGRLTPEEFDIMKRHTEIGKKLLSNSNSHLLDVSAIVAHEHHERYDGKGYPRGLAGEEIHIYGRITAIADVFDALGNARCYKPAWDIDKVFDYMREQRGRQFDPALIDLFLEHEKEVLEIRESFKD
jgi:response regulator RpfG family c-di-GMP phosphodiesterase